VGLDECPDVLDTEQALAATDPTLRIDEVGCQLSTVAEIS
jgi:hypothetical protein